MPLATWTEAIATAPEGEGYHAVGVLVQLGTLAAAIEPEGSPLQLLNRGLEENPDQPFTFFPVPGVQRSLSPGRRDRIVQITSGPPGPQNAICF